MPDESKVNNFDVLRAMSEANGKIYLAPLSNITNLRKVKAGTQVTIGVGSDFLAGLATGKYVGGLILADRAEFDAMRAKLAEED